ncbi:hypothetical protein V6N13_137395 [Hibiscus sabdariffa]|uniref:Uncharacterized protein n=1 Tax=Hibiscus sabdariffa TaxID=183260 RepID=A0ABR2DLV6_9ROSI
MISRSWADSGHYLLTPAVGQIQEVFDLCASSSLLPDLKDLLIVASKQCMHKMDISSILDFVMEIETCMPRLLAARLVVDYAHLLSSDFSAVQDSLCQRELVTYLLERARLMWMDWCLPTST